MKYYCRFIIWLYTRVLTYAKTDSEIPAQTYLKVKAELQKFKIKYKHYV